MTCLWHVLIEIVYLLPGISVGLPTTKHCYKCEPTIVVNPWDGLCVKDCSASGICVLGIALLITLVCRKWWFTGQILKLRSLGACDMIRRFSFHCLSCAIIQMPFFILVSLRLCALIIAPELITLSNLSQWMTLPVTVRKCWSRIRFLHVILFRQQIDLALPSYQAYCICNMHAHFVRFLWKKEKMYTMDSLRAT